MIEFPPFRIDVDNQCVWEQRAGEADRRIVLRPKAFEMLCHLARNAGRVVTEAELLEAVWPRIYVQPEAIRGRLFEIRSALGDKPKDARFVETVPRRGYRFVAQVRQAGPGAAPRPREHRLFVGREAALARLHGGLSEAAAGQQQIAFVAGEPGIGKSALIETFVREAAARHTTLRIARGQCIEGFGGKEAYYPMLEALNRLCEGPQGHETVETLAQCAPTWLAQFPALLTREHREMLRQEILGATRERMLREIVAAFEALTRAAPLLLVFEDLQWVDRSTIDLLCAVARKTSALRLMVVATYRPLELALADHPLQEVKRDLLLRKACSELDLAPLDEAEIASYLSGLAPAPPEGLASLLFRHTEGNPLFMIAALDDLAQRGLVAHDGQGWVLRVPMAEVNVEVPETLRQMIETQIRRLTPPQQAALEAASVVGSGFSIRVGACAADMDEDDFDELCDVVSRGHRLLRPAGFQCFPDGERSQCYEFFHALYRDVFMRRLTPRRRTAAHRNTAVCLEQANAHHLSEVASEIALHLDACGDWPKVVHYLGLAADMAERRYAPREACAFLERALELVDRLPPAQQVKQRLQLLERLTQNYMLGYDPRVIATCHALAECAQQCGRVDVQVRALREAAEHLSWNEGQLVLATLERIRDSVAVQPDELVRAEVEMQCAVWPILIGQWSETCARDCADALARIRQLASPAASAPHMINFSFIPLTRSNYEEAYETAHEGLSILAPGSRNPCSTYPQTMAAYVMYNASLFAGEWGRADAIATETMEMFTLNGHDAASQVMRLRGAWLQLSAMDHAGASATCRAVAQALGSNIKGSHARLLQTLSGAAQVGLGNLRQARQLLESASRDWSESTAHNAWRTAMQLHSSLLELAMCEGDLAQARQHADNFLAHGREMPERTWQALAWEAAARVAMASGEARRARACIEEALAVMRGLKLPVAAWRVHATAALLQADDAESEDRRIHLDTSRETIAGLAASLPRTHALRQAFLRSALVRQVMEADPAKGAYLPS